MEDGSTIGGLMQEQINAMHKKVGESENKITEGLFEKNEAAQKKALDFGVSLSASLVAGMISGDSQQAFKSAMGLVAQFLCSFIPGGSALGGIFSGILSKAQHGTQYARGGLTMVGEAGPELASIPAGSRIYSRSETKMITRETNNNTTNKPMIFVINGGRQQIAEQMRGAIRERDLDVNDMLSRAGVR
jgi:hypothetical protein